MRGRVTRIIPVRHVDMIGNEDVQWDVENEDRLELLLSYVRFEDPVAIARAENLTSRQRRGREEKRRRLNELLERPPVKPSDLVVVLEPCEQDEEDCGKRLILVFRFWVHGEENSRCVFMIDMGKIPPLNNFVTPKTIESFLLPIISTESTSTRIVDVNEVLILKYGSPRTDYTYPRMGVNASGEPFFVYSFFLYTDGMSISRVTAESAEGIYMVPVHLPSRFRNSKDICRVLSLAPSGVSPYVIVNELVDNIVTGSTEGFLFYDADGSKRRVYFDFVGVKGDTPAINYGIDVLGHKGSSFCHLFRVPRRVDTLSGSHYAFTTQSELLTAVSLFQYRHEALHASKADDDTLTRLGLKKVTVNEVVNTRGMLHSLATKLRNASKNAPKTNDGAPILPFDFDLFASSFITPDHLLTGLFQDCFQFAVFALKKRRFRMAFESYCLQALKALGLPSQNRLLNRDSGKLLPMTISQRYSLNSVAHVCYARTLHEVVLPADNATVTRGNLVAHRILLAFCHVIGTLWESKTEGYVKKAQRHIAHYLELVRTVCAIRTEDLVTQGLDFSPGIDDDDDDSGNESNSTSLVNVSDVRRGLRFLDKPNLHRLWEFGFRILPTTQHCDVTQELHLERVHVALRSSVERARHHHDPFSFSMLNAIMDD